MADFDDADPTAEDEFENDDEEMDDANEPDADVDADADADDDQGGDEDDEDDDVENDDNDEDDDEDGDDNDAPDPSPSRRPITQPRPSPPRHQDDRLASNPSLIRTSPSPHPAVDSATSSSTSTHLHTGTGPGTTTLAFQAVRPEAVTAQAYDIVPTMAAPQGTSINALTATPDMRWVFTGGTDGYVRMYNWADTANGKVPLTVAQKHPFVDSVMKAGSLHTYWENEEAGSTLRTPSRRDVGEEVGKWISPVYSLAVQQQAVWLLSGLESGGINLQTCRHEAGTLITSLREHASAVSVLALARDEQSVLSGSWDKSVLDWDLHTGQVKRGFRGSGGQICAVEFRPASDMPIPEMAEKAVLPGGWVGTLGSNNADRPTVNGGFVSNGIRKGGVAATLAAGGEEDAVGSPNESLFGENDHGSLFGEDNVPGGVGGAGGGGNSFADDDDEELSRAIASGLQETEQDAAGEQDIEMVGFGMGGPVQSPQREPTTLPPDVPDGQPSTNLNGAPRPASPPPTSTTGHAATEPITNGLPHGYDNDDDDDNKNNNEPLTAPPTNDPTTTSAATDLPLQSESTFLSAAIDGSLRLWDRRRERPIAVLPPSPGTPPWCTGACWSPDGNAFYVGRRNNMVEEYSIHHFTSGGAAPVRQLKLPPGSGPVYAVRAMPNSRHLVCASQDILRVYDLRQPGSGRGSVPFTIVPGHRGGVISAVWVDPTCRFMLSAAGNRGWEGGGTEVLLGYEIGVLDESGVWHR